MRDPKDIQEQIEAVLKMRAHEYVAKRCGPDFDLHHYREAFTIDRQTVIDYVEAHQVRVEDYYSQCHYLTFEVFERDGKWILRKDEVDERTGPFRRETEFDSERAARQDLLEYVLRPSDVALGVRKYTPPKQPWWKRLLPVALLFAAAGGVRGADASHLGTWKIESATVAPWWRQKTPPDPATTKELIGRTVKIAPKAISGPPPMACAAPRYAVKQYPADMLFQGAFGEMQRRDRTVDPAKLAESAGFRGSAWKTVETGCDNGIDFHFIDGRTAAFALDNYIYRLKRQF